MTNDEIKKLIKKCALFKDIVADDTGLIFLKLKMMKLFENRIRKNNLDENRELLIYSFDLLEKHKSEYLKDILVGSLNQKTKKTYKNFFKTHPKKCALFFNTLNFDETYANSLFLLTLSYITPKSKTFFDNLNLKEKRTKILTNNLSKISFKYRRYEEKEKLTIKNRLTRFLILINLLLIFIIMTCSVPAFLIYIFKNDKLSFIDYKRALEKAETDLDYIGFLLQVESSKIEDISKLVQMSLESPEFLENGKLKDVDYFNLLYKI